MKDEHSRSELFDRVITLQGEINDLTGEYVVEMARQEQQRAAVGAGLPRIRGAVGDRLSLRLGARVSLRRCRGRGVGGGAAALGRQPMKPGGQYGREDQAAFRTWARKRLGEEDVRRIEDVQRRYFDTGRRAGLFSEGGMERYTRP